jgi:hypothetical protein
MSKLLDDSGKEIIKKALLNDNYVLEKLIIKPSVPKMIIGG